VTAAYRRRVVGKFQYGRYAELPRYLTHIRGRRMDITCAGNGAVNIDGETHADRKDQLFPYPVKKLRFIAPKGANWNTESDKNQEFFRKRA
jgi:diacylglycerol kinase family enzyme